MYIKRILFKKKIAVSLFLWSHHAEERTAVIFSTKNGINKPASHTLAQTAFQPVRYQHKWT